MGRNNGILYWLFLFMRQGQRCFQSEKGGAVKAIKGIFILGAGLKDKAKPIDPDTLIKASVSWSKDIKELAPWGFLPMLPVQGNENRYWFASGDRQCSPIIISGPCSSSMDLAWNFVQKEFMPVWGSVLALRQWAGRGQSGRQWVSPIGNIYGACRFPGLSQSWSEMLPLVTGYALVKAFSKLGVNMLLKWPNDLVMGNTKVGGILMENKGNAIVAGIGLNLLSSPDKNELRKDNAIPAASLSDFGHHFTPLALWRNLMSDVRNHFNNMIQTENPLRFIEEVQPHLAFVGKEVSVLGHDGRYHATLMGLSSNGGLELVTGTERKTIQSGSIIPLTD
jgi:BirA family biotin operon repressor/biotin-[acetyl-CoA-carboxylase] ligase